MKLSITLPVCPSCRFAEAELGQERCEDCDEPIWWATFVEADPRPQWVQERLAENVAFCHARKDPEKKKVASEASEQRAGR